MPLKQVTLPLQTGWALKGVKRFGNLAPVVQPATRQLQLATRQLKEGYLLVHACRDQSSNPLPPTMGYNYAYSRYFMHKEIILQKGEGKNPGKFQKVLRVPKIDPHKIDDYWVTRAHGKTTTNIMQCTLFISSSAISFQLGSFFLSSVINFRR